MKTEIANPNLSALKVNDRVEVFYDPITMQDREGIAHIDAIDQVRADGMAFCRVTFQELSDYEPETFLRWINPASVLPVPLPA